jgi:hypothetical protein
MYLQIMKNFNAYLISRLMMERRPSPTLSSSVFFFSCCSIILNCRLVIVYKFRSSFVGLFPEFQTSSSNMASTQKHLTSAFQPSRCINNIAKKRKTKNKKKIASFVNENDSSLCVFKVFLAPRNLQTIFINIYILNK